MNALRGHVRIHVRLLARCFATLIVATSAAQTLDERPAQVGEWGFRPAAGVVTERNPPSFSWRPQRGARTYHLQVSRDPSFERVDYDAASVAWNVHCPNRVLEPGEWSWRFRMVDDSGASGAWSRTRTFTIPDDAAHFALPSRDELLARIPKEHPRLFVRPGDLPRLREFAKGSLRPSFDRLVAQCDRLLKSPPPADEPPRYPKGTARKSEQWRAIWWGNRRKTIAVLESAATLAFTWRLGGREEYAQLARRLLLAAAEWDPKGATGYRYNDEAGMPFAYHFSRAYTFLFPELSAAERVRCREVMRVRGTEMFRHLARGHLWQPYSSHSNRAWHFLGEVGIAFHGEIPEASDWVDFAVQVFANVYPVWSDADGGWHEGMAYWRSYLLRFTWWADVQKKALGLDAYELPFFSRAGFYAMYLNPPGTVGGGFGDQNAALKAVGNRRLMTVFAQQAGDPHWQWYVEQLGGPDFGAGYVAFLRAAAPAKTARPPDDLPTSRLFRGTGQAVLNTSLRSAKDNVEVIFKSSPFGTQSHGYESQNSFLLYAFGERLLIRTGKRDVYGSKHHTQWMWRTRSVNSITLAGKGQSVHSAKARGRITDFHTEPGLHTVEGEASGAYGKRLDSFRRRILLIEPDLLVVIDRVRAVNPTAMEWLLHARAPFESTGPDTFEVHSGTAGCSVQFLGPQGLTFAQTDRFDPPPRPRVKLVEHHLRAEVEPRKDVRFVTVIRPFRAAQRPPGAATVRQAKGGSLIIAPVLDGTAEILARPDGSVTVRRLDADGEVVLRRELGARARER